MSGPAHGAFAKAYHNKKNRFIMIPLLKPDYGNPQQSGRVALSAYTLCVSLQRAQGPVTPCYITVMIIIYYVPYSVTVAAT